VTSNANYQFSDGTESKTLSCTIEKKSLTEPAQNGTLIYNVEEQTVSWDTNYDSGNMIL
jgi:hypothetical protein